MLSLFLYSLGGKLSSILYLPVKLVGKTNILAPSVPAPHPPITITCCCDRHGVQELKENPAGSSFSTFWPMVIYHVSFFIFITTIGLNIIFGIIVDTFSELRDLKVSL